MSDSLLAEFERKFDGEETLYFSCKIDSQTRNSDQPYDDGANYTFDVGDFGFIYLNKTTREVSVESGVEDSHVLELVELIM